MSIAEVTELLVGAGASAIMTEFDDGHVVGLSFKLPFNRATASYRLPCNWQGTLEALKRDARVPGRNQNDDHARRVAWRVLRDWVRAQLSLIEAGAATPQQVLLPYQITNNGRTVYERIADPTMVKLLGSGPQEPEPMEHRQ